MPMPTTVYSYDLEWMLIAQKLNEAESLTLPVQNVKQAKSLRLRFYGFRRALGRHDPTNPYLGNLMQTQVTVTPSGDLHFDRDPYGALLRGLLEHSIVRLPNKNESLLEAIVKRDEPVGMTESDKTILSVLTKKE